MNLSLSYTDFKDYVLNQLNHFFPDKQKTNDFEYNKAFNMAINRIEYCFKHVNISTYCKNDNTYLNHLHSDQYAVFLWFLSNSVYIESNDDKLANKLFYLNKALHGFNCMYDTELPSIFLLLHVVGTVLGKAQYSDFFIATQGCTVGAHHGQYPIIGKGVSMLPNSSVIGDCCIGKRVALGINTTIYKEDVQDDSVVFVKNGINNFKKIKYTWAQHFFYRNLYE